MAFSQAPDLLYFSYTYTSSSAVKSSLWTIPVPLLLTQENLRQNYTPTGDNQRVGRQGTEEQKGR